MDHYAAHETEADVIWAKEKIASNSDWITYYSNLPNSEVLGLMKRAHIGLLPTYADTYGYSVLEFQASGCPVITTNIRALPEINNDQVGWLIDVPRNSLGEALYTTESARRELGNRISGGLESIIEQIMLEPKLILKKSQSAFEQIHNNHDPADYGERLTQIYRDALR
jgi:glycosyltransferase involved in cell wall biosynthesis